MSFRSGSTSFFKFPIMCLFVDLVLPGRPRLDLGLSKTCEKSDRALISVLSPSPHSQERYLSNIIQTGIGPATLGASS
ncbi:hypothetical protein BKA62DRAFT_694897 [Auriculariales sp. MPI-PUGE-AT-0066]|nr:hypothetical protein BKA62DRAFT_694897 [Auriculariales sp. MPI-PUGE-AT-0066]